MAEGYRIIGAEMSPYSVKVRSYFRYKAIPHQWVLRNAASQADYARHAKIPVIPLVVTPEDVGIQDSTPIIDRMEELFPEPHVHPDDPVARFISMLMEEFGDEWGNKWMFHYRWARDVDQRASAGRIARMMAPKASEAEFAPFADQVRARMTGRVWFVGSNEANGPSVTLTFSPISNCIFGRARSIVPDSTLPRMRSTSACGTGKGFLPPSAPRKPVTFGVFLTRW